jgi:hypothetical protein
VPVKEAARSSAAGPSSGVAALHRSARGRGDQRAQGEQEREEQQRRAGRVAGKAPPDDEAHREGEQPEELQRRAGHEVGRGRGLLRERDGRGDVERRDQGEQQEEPQRSSGRGAHGQ